MDRVKVQELLNLLRQDEYRTAGQLSQHLGVSEKTVRIGIHELNTRSAEWGGKIVSKARYGYRMEILDKERFEESQIRMEKKGQIPEGGQERSEYLLAYLLFRQTYIKAEELCDFIYVSKTTLSHCLKMVEAILRRYRLSIERRPNYGMRIQGDEFDIRRLISDYFIKRHCLEGMDITHQSEELSRLANQVKRLMDQYDIHISELSFENFVDYTYVAWKRMKAGYYLKMNKENLAEIGIKEQSFIRELSEILLGVDNLVFTKDEENALLLYLAGKRMIGSIVENDSNFVIHERTDRLAMEMLKLVSKEYRLSFHNNFEMRMTLNQHLVPFDIRMRYDIPLKNPMIQEIKEKYCLAYQMAGVACRVLKDSYEKDIPEDEVGYFALIFELALEKDQLERRSDILVVCSTGKGTSRLLKYKYEQEFSEFLNQIHVSDLLGLDHFDFSKIDYIFTTVPITKEVPVPIVEVGMFLGSDDIRKVTEVLKFGTNDDLIRRYYGPDRFLSGVRCESKEEILSYICDIIACQETVDCNFYDLVLEREAYVQMDYGNYIALPHPNQIASEESFAYVAVLEHPVIWNNLPVQVVLLSSIGKNADKDKERQRFYEITARFALSGEAVSELIKKPEYKVLARLLGR